MELTDELRLAIKSQLTAKPGQSEKSKHRKRIGGMGIWCKPHASEALGVSPEQVPEARAALRAHGVTADFDKQGRCLVTSDKQFRDVAKACGMWDGRDGYQVKNNEGVSILSGRGQEDYKQELKRRIMEEM